MHWTAVSNGRKFVVEYHVRYFGFGFQESRETQTQFFFQESHPLIRNLNEYGIFIRQQTQEPQS